MSLYDGWATLPIDKGTEGDVARALLALAETPHHVVKVAGKLEFLVPDDLAEAYRKSLTPARKRRTTKGNDDG